VDLRRVIRSLRAELKRIDDAITALEGIESVGEVSPTRKPSGKRGRKDMSEEERQEVSQRMRRYWAGKRDRKPKAG
jgi:hypothetical protein